MIQSMMTNPEKEQPLTGMYDLGKQKKYAIIIG
jgi:hypothetical protein